MSFTEIFKRDSFLYIIPCQPDESRDTHLDRMEFVLNLHEKNKNIQFDELIRLSMLWRNVHIYNMLYSSRTMRQIQDLMN